MSSRMLEPAGTLCGCTPRYPIVAEVMTSDEVSGSSKKIEFRLFEPPFSTKHFEVGLGISIVQSILQAHSSVFELFVDEKGCTAAASSVSQRWEYFDHRSTRIAGKTSN